MYCTGQIPATVLIVYDAEIALAPEIAEAGAEAITVPPA